MITVSSHQRRYKHKYMKRITIPERFGYPTLEITINGKEQTFSSGVEIEVEDSVAEAIDNAIALAPKQGRYKSRLAQLVEGSLTEITASDLDGIETIVYYAFGQCYSLKSIEIPNSLKQIVKSAFTGCTSLKSVRFGDESKIDNIGENAFYYCQSLESVYLPPKPPILENANAFSDIKSTCVFYCKTQASLDAYKAATNWSTLAGTYTFKVEE